MATTAAEAIREAFNALKGRRKAQEIKAWVQAKYPDRWKDITTDMADLVVNGNKSSTYKDSKKFLKRVSPGVYELA